MAFYVSFEKRKIKTHEIRNDFVVEGNREK
jgi:hypothetical protein